VEQDVQISVITTCFNSAKTIRHTIESFLDQDYDHRQMFIIDGGSKDDTLEIVHSYKSDKILVNSERDNGIFDAMNRGLRSFTGDAMGFLNSDDSFHATNSLSKIADVLSSKDIAYGHLQFVEAHETKAISRKWAGSQHSAGDFKSGWMPAHPTFYVRSHVARQVGEFDLSMRVAADYDWMLRAVELYGFTSGLVDDVLIDMLIGGNSTNGLKPYLDGNLESLRSRQRWLGAGVVDLAFFAKPARKLGQFLVSG
jgi:glycosyltransferase involved in cell wall biosynthesis